MRLASLALAGLVAGGCAPDHPGPPAPAAVVLTVIDGDTIEVRTGSHTELVRLIGIDTPEVAHHGQPDECHGPEAAHRLRQLLPPGSIVRLERDQEARDVYGRLLAYVYEPAGQLVNLVLAREGHARALAIAPNLLLADQVADAAGDARARGLGLWGRCGTEP